MADYTGGLGEMLIGMANENQRRREKGLGFILEEENQRETKLANKETKSARIESEKRQDKYNVDMLNLKNTETSNQKSYNDKMIELKEKELNSESNYSVNNTGNGVVVIDKKSGKPIGIYGATSKESGEKKPSSQAPYGYNKDGSIKTAQQYGEEETSKKRNKWENKKKISNTEI